MQSTVARLLANLGNSCVLVKITHGEYQPNIGKVPEYEETISTYSTSIKNSSLVLSLGNAQNFDLSGFDEDKVLIPYLTGYVIDDTWRYRDNKQKEKEIQKVEKIEAQDNIIGYVLTLKG